MGTLLLLHAAALLVLLNLPLQWWAKGVIALIVFASLTFNILRHITRSFKRSVVACQLELGQWQLTLRQKKQLTVTLEKESVVTQFLVIMRFKDHKRCYVVMLFKDSVAKSKWQQLQRFLHSSI
jgi:hypothetical protein